MDTFPVELIPVNLISNKLSDRGTPLSSGEAPPPFREKM